MPTSSVDRENVHNILVICSRSSCLQTIPPPLNETYGRSVNWNVWEVFSKEKQKAFCLFLKIGISQHFRRHGLHVLPPNISLGWSSAEILAIWDVLHILDIWDVLHISALFPHCSDLHGNSHLDYYVVETENSYTNHLVRNVLRSPTFIPSFKTSV